MSADKYIALDVHMTTVVASVLDGSGREVSRTIMATKAEEVRGFLKGLRGEAARDPGRRDVLGLAVRSAGGTGGRAQSVALRCAEAQHGLNQLDPYAGGKNPNRT
jgi:hypothetical protein